MNKNTKGSFFCWIMLKNVKSVNKYHKTPLILIFVNLYTEFSNLFNKNIKKIKKNQVTLNF